MILRNALPRPVCRRGALANEKCWPPGCPRRGTSPVELLGHLGATFVNDARLAVLAVVVLLEGDEIPPLPEHVIQDELAVLVLPHDPQVDAALALELAPRPRRIGVREPRAPAPAEDLALAAEH